MKSPLKMATKDDILLHFKELNIEVNDAVLNKCIELCDNYNIESEDFVDQWFAFTTSNLNGAAPSVDNLDKMERRVFQKNKEQSFSRKTINTPKSARKPQGSASNSLNLAEDIDRESLEDISSSTTPKSNRNAEILPDQNFRKSLNYTTLINDDIAPISSPTSAKYSQRSDSRTVQCSFGDPTAKFRRQNSVELAVRMVNEDVNTDIMKYMYEVMGGKATSLNNITQWLGQAILHKERLTVTDAPIKTTGGEMITYGRIVSDSDGKINVQSVLLECTQEVNMGHTVTLNLSKLPAFSLFPGQVAVVQGTHIINSNMFVVQNIHTNGALDLQMEPPVVDDTMEIVVATGPFTLQGNLSYEPLNDLLRYVVEYQPHLLILVGPFLEDTHENANDGSLTQTFDAFFESIVETIMTQLDKIDVQVVMVSSQRDVHHHPIYPTPPYRIREKYNKLMLVPDPCLINVNGLIIGATSVDALLHIGNYEIFQDQTAKGPADRLGRLASHILNQQSFYPLYPPNVDVNVDHELLDSHGVLECTPHILVLPSNLRSFVKNINGCLVVNPERLTKGYVAGTFARIEISPGTSTSICNRTACQILKV